LADWRACDRVAVRHYGGRRSRGRRAGGQAFPREGGGLLIMPRGGPVGGTAQPAA